VASTKFSLAKLHSEKKPAQSKKQGGINVMARLVLIVPVILLAAAGEPPRQTSPNSSPDGLTGAEAPAASISSDNFDVGMPGFSSPTCSPIYGEQLAAVGPAQNDPEKNNYARVIVGEACQ
jgi:hypothetical protein